jgi:hypothetical protein
MSGAVLLPPATGIEQSQNKAWTANGNALTVFEVTQSGGTDALAPIAFMVQDETYGGLKQSSMRLGYNPAQYFGTQYGEMSLTIHPWAGDANAAEWVSTWTPPSSIAGVAGCNFIEALGSMADGGLSLSIRDGDTNTGSSSIGFQSGYAINNGYASGNEPNYMLMKFASTYGVAVFQSMSIQENRAANTVTQLVLNGPAGASTGTNCSIELNSDSGGLNQFVFAIAGAAWWTIDQNATNLKMLDNQHSSRNMITWTGGASAAAATTEIGSVLLCDSSVVVGTAALATTATDGFLYLPSCAGVPTGTPTAKTGTIPFVFDTTDGKLYFYTGGAWVGLAD